MSAAVVIVAFVVQEGRNIVWGLQRGLQCHRPAKRHGTRSDKTDVNLLHFFFFSFTICVNTEVIYYSPCFLRSVCQFCFWFVWFSFEWSLSQFGDLSLQEDIHTKWKIKKIGRNKHGNERNFWKDCFQDVLNERVHEKMETYQNEILTLNHFCLILLILFKLNKFKLMIWGQTSSVL